MTEYYDQHLHTHHSFDSTELFENYLNQTKKPLVTTEHLDFCNPADHFKDSLPNFHVYDEEIKSLEDKFNRSILRGIEIGYVPNQDQQIKEFIANHPYDVLLLSTHQNGKIDFMDPIVKKIEPKQLITEYYQQMLCSIDKMPHVNILTHFDYGVRQLDISLERYREFAEPLLIEIFKKIISYDISLELNAKSFISYQNKHLYEYAIPLYLSLGGTRFTLGSDAHVASDYEKGFAEMQALLKINSVNKLVVYKQQKPTYVTF